MPLYEHTFVTRQDISPQQVEDLARDLSTIIENMGGRIARAEYWGLRNLAFRVKNNRKGHYVLLNIDAPSDAVKEMERNIRLNDDVIRNMTVRVEEIEDGASAVMRGRSSNDARMLVGIGDTQAEARRPRREDNKEDAE
jgi:small subunit ribosomal protein S6